jgi:flavin reductase (DIM6/NTAB) family NADH-FMN oxidoreductase RutF
MPTSPETETFEAIMGKLDYPMFLVTTVAGDERSGCLVGFATQCSIDPPRFMVCLSDKNHTARVAARGEALAVHLVPACEMALARLFGSHTGDEVDKFAHCAWHPGPAGLPILDDCESWFAGWIIDRFPWGDHVGFEVEVFAARRGGDEAHLTFRDVRELEPGHDA